MIRWLKFNAVGILGAGVQLTMLALLVRLGLNYLAATVLAVETALVAQLRLAHALDMERTAERKARRIPVAISLFQRAGFHCLERDPDAGVGRMGRMADDSGQPVGHRRHVSAELLG